MYSQDEYNITKQNNRIMGDIKINLLNYNFQKVDELSGVLLSGSTYSCDAGSDIRRTCNISLIPTDSSFDISVGNKIWLDKYIQIYVGINNVKTDEIVYSNLGIYMINNPSRVYSSENNTMTIQGLDLMAKMTGLRNGNLEGLPHIIKANSNVRNAIISTLELAGFNNYVVEDCKFNVPNEIKIDVGGTVYDILKELRDIDSTMEIYFDTNGVFHYDKIPSGHNEQIMVDNDIWEKTLIDYNIDTNFETVKNVIEVYGKTHDITNYSDATISENNYVLTIANVSSLRDNLKIGFTTPSTVISGQSNIKINSLTSYPLKNEDGTIPILLANTYYVAKFIQSDNYYLFMGEITPYGIIEETNPNSPFYINGTFGKVRIVLSGSDYDSIYMSTLAQQRAEWELYTRCKLKDSVTLTCVPIYWLDVNWLIEITLPNKQGTETTEQYIIKSINTTLDIEGTQSINIMKYYPLYPSI